MKRKWHWPHGIKSLCAYCSQDCPTLQSPRKTVTALSMWCGQSPVGRRTPKELASGQQIPPVTQTFGFYLGFHPDGCSLSASCCTHGGLICKAPLWFHGSTAGTSILSQWISTADFWCQLKPQLGQGVNKCSTRSHCTLPWNQSPQLSHH